MTVPPANWYADPQERTQLRYWDGTRWTEHTSPVTASPAPQNKGMSGGAIAAIVVGSIVAALVVVGILAAIAVPVFLNQRDKASDAGARSDLHSIALLIADAYVDDANGPTAVTDLGTFVEVDTATGADAMNLTPTTRFGGYVSDADGNYCVWVTSTSTETQFAINSAGEVREGTCSAS